MSVHTYRSFALEVGEPVAVARSGPFEKLGWGPCQFPSLRFTGRGHVLCTWAVGEDSIEGYEDSAESVFRGAVSEDGGLTWRARTAEDRAAGIPVAGGREFFPPDAKNAYPAPWLEQYVPEYVSGDGYMALYRAEGIPEYPAAASASEYDPAAGETVSFPMRVRWPHLALQAFTREGRTLVYPFASLMGIMGRALPDGEGGLYFATYCHGFSAATGALSLPDKYNVYVFHSVDRGRTWEWISEVLTEPEYVPESPNAEGFCEPDLARMPDGSHVMLMRMGGWCPSWLVRSVDGCRSWSKPVRFDDCGVLPRILPLGCGVTLASYGRPGVFLRATADPAGLRWEERIDLGVPAEPLSSCSYTSILPLDDTNALLAYSHFRWPDPEGTPVKTILTRRITVRL